MKLKGKYPHPLSESLENKNSLLLGLPVAAYLYIVAKDNGSMLRSDYLDEAIKVCTALSLS